MGLLGVALLASGCAAPAPRTRADIGAQAACRLRADQAFQTSNRDAPYRQDAYDSGLKDAPFSSSGTARDFTRGLGDEYARDNAVQRCLQGIGEPGTDVQVAPLAPK